MGNGNLHVDGGVIGRVKMRCVKGCFLFRSNINFILFLLIVKADRLDSLVYPDLSLCSFFCNAAGIKNVINTIFDNYCKNIAREIYISYLYHKLIFF